MRNEEGDPAPEIPFIHCPLLNITSCNYTEKLSSYIVTVYNPLSRVVDKYVRLPVAGKAYSVRDPDGTQI